MRLNPKKTKSMLNLCYGDLTLGGAEIKEVMRLRIFRVPLDSKLTFEIHLREVVSKAAISFGIVIRAEKLFECSHVLNTCFNAYALFNLSALRTTLSSKFK